MSKASHAHNFKDISGQRFGSLLVLKFARRRNNSAYWLCKCKCGNVKEARGSCMKLGKIKSCGCARKGCKVINLVGKRFGKLQVVSFHSIRNHIALWNCKCNCGKDAIRRSDCLRRKEVKSCGCARNEAILRKSRIDCRKLIGDKFNQLTIIRFLGFRKLKQLTPFFLCQCDCGNPVKVSKHSICSGNTKSCGCRQGDKTGSKNPNYNPSLSDEDRKNRRDLFGYRKWRRDVLKRDKNICQISGKQGNLCVHHIMSWRDNPDIRFSLENGITILNKLHDLFHTMYGRGNNTKMQFEQFEEQYRNGKFSV